MQTILFICTGNTCRSPMAEAIARDALDRSIVAGGRGVFVASAGVHASNDRPVSPETVATLRARGIEHSGTSKRLTGEMIRRADLVLAMSEAHVAAARQLVSGELAEEAKIQRLDPAGEIEDPIGLGQAAYDGLADRLMELVPRRLSEVMAAVRPCRD